MYLKLGFIKQYGMSGLNVFLMLKLPREKKRNKYTYGVSYREAP